jgi:hypothetical protein
MEQTVRSSTRLRRSGRGSAIATLRGATAKDDVGGRGSGRESRWGATEEAISKG